MRNEKCTLIILIISCILIVIPLTSGLYKIGVGKADCTGPASEIVFMGYGKANQKGCGIHLRQFSRAFIFDDGNKRAVFVSVDIGMIGDGIRRTVLDNLRRIYNNTYSENNIMLSGTHTHCAPGGFLMYFLYDIPTLGFVSQTYDSLVSGITRSIIKAHENIIDGKIYLAAGELLGASINRSPTSYSLNPEEERAKYPYNVDKDMVLLKLVKASDNSLIGAISWFPVHPTSMNNTNCLISSDNVGFASILLEKLLNKDPGKEVFVGAFASTNLGDVSPNTNGPRCINSGEECDIYSSSCNGRSQLCIASGPGEDMFDSTKIIAHKLFSKAKELLEYNELREITGSINFIHQFVDMPKETAEIKLPNGTVIQVHGCLPAMGQSFAAGTTDGPGEFDFKQGMRSDDITYWNTLRDLILPPTQEEIACQYPKAILISSGRISTPYQWQPRIVSTQLIQLGEVVLIAVPGEFTTMSGRRLRNAVKETLMSNGGSHNIQPIIAGLSNTYSSYITTPEEYKMQRYEGASTIFGPHTLTIYLKVYSNLAKALVKGENLDPGPTPVDFSSKLLSLVTGVMFDTTGTRHRFGDCILQPPQKVKKPTTVTVKFVSGHPRNNLMQEQTFLSIEKLIKGKKWIVVATDADWETKFKWRRTSFLMGESETTIEWDIESHIPTGTYRIRHFGYYKSFFNGINPYNGTTNNFEIV